jgi:hypothetical protein
MLMAEDRNALTFGSNRKRVLHMTCARIWENPMCLHIGFETHSIRIETVSKTLYSGSDSFEMNKKKLFIVAA